MPPPASSPRWLGPANRATVVTAAPASWPSCGDRKSTRLNSSHGYISYAVFCLKKKKKKTIQTSNPLWLTHCSMTNLDTSPNDSKKITGAEPPHLLSHNTEMLDSSTSYRAHIFR